MADKKRISELEKAIKESKAELEKARSNIKAAENDPEKLVLARKAERRISEQVQALERAREIASFTPPEPSDKVELLLGLKKYYDAHAERLNTVHRSIEEAEREREEINAGLQQAAEDCDTEATVKLTGRQSDNAAKLQALHEMRERAEAFPVFPDGAIAGEWAAICKAAMPGWKAAVLRVETMAAEYKAACNDLLQMHDTLKAVRDDLYNTATAEGVTPPPFSPVFTAGLDVERLVVKRGDCYRVSTIASHSVSAAI